MDKIRRQESYLNTLSVTPASLRDEELLAFSDATIGALLLRVKKANVNALRPVRLFLATSTEATEGSQIAAMVPDGQGFNRLIGKHRVVGGKSSEVSRICAGRSRPVCSMAPKSRS